MPIFSIRSDVAKSDIDFAHTSRVKILLLLKTLSAMPLPAIKKRGITGGGSTYIAYAENKAGRSRRIWNGHHRKRR